MIAVLLGCLFGFLKDCFILHSFLLCFIFNLLISFKNPRFCSA